MVRFWSLLFLAVAGAIAGAAPALSQEPYVTGFGGLHGTRDMDLDVSSGSSRGGSPRELELGSGFVVGGAIGARLGESFRVEGEIAYRSNNADRLSFSGGGSLPVEGDLQSLSLMANTWYDVPLSDRVIVSAGGGLGAAWISLDSGEIQGLSGATIDDTDAGFAYQLGAGAAYEFESGMSLGLGYRYFSVGNLDFEATGPASSIGGDYRGHSIMATFTIPIGRMLGGR